MSTVFSGSSSHGTIKGYVGFDAAQQAILSVKNYMGKIAPEEGTDSRSIVPGVGAAATVVGAITGVAGLFTGKSGSTATVELELYNASNSIVVPWKATTEYCSLAQAAHPLTPGESLSLRGEGSDDQFATNSSNMEFVFRIGSAKTIEVMITFAIILQGTWCVSKFVVDGTEISGEIIPEASVERLQAITFEGNSDYPSFALYSHPMHSNSGGKTYLLFGDFPAVA